VVGGLLVVLAALGTFVAATGDDEGPTGRYVVATHTIGPGARLSAADLEVVAGELPPDVAATTFASSEELDGAVALAPLDAGSLVQQADVHDPTGDHDAAQPEVSLRLPRAQAVDGDLALGEQVDLLATYGSGPDATTHVIARDALVTAVGREDTAGLGDDGGVTLTVRLPDDATVLRAIHAKDVATVTVVRATGSQDEASTGPDRYAGPGRSPGPGDEPATATTEGA
jgi:hypothetical protein